MPSNPRTMALAELSRSWLSRSARRPFNGIGGSRSHTKQMSTAIDQLNIVDMYDVGGRGGLVSSWRSSVKTNVAWAHSLRYERPKVDHLFTIFIAVSTAFAAKDREKLKRIVVPRTYGLMCADMDKFPRSRKLDWQASRQARHTLVQCRLDRGDDKKILQVTAKFKYDRMLMLRDDMGRSIAGNDEPETVVEYCVFEKDLWDPEQTYRYVAKLKEANDRTDSATTSGENDDPNVPKASVGAA